MQSSLIVAPDLVHIVTVHDSHVGPKTMHGHSQRCYIGRRITIGVNNHLKYRRMLEPCHVLHNRYRITEELYNVRNRERILGAKMLVGPVAMAVIHIFQKLRLIE